MMRRALVALPILALVMCFGAPGQAQVRVREHGKKKKGDGHKVKVREHDKKGDGHRRKIRDRRRPPPRHVPPRRRPPRRVGVQVTGFSPRIGPRGTVVTITGRGFAARTKVFVGGRPARRTSYNDTTLIFSVPARTRDGLIVLRHPGVPRDIVVGNFELVVAARIWRMSPLSGPVGTLVELRGSGFRQGDQVLLGSSPVVPSSLTARRITVSVPPGARSGFFLLRRAGSRDARSRRPRQHRPAQHGVSNEPLETKSAASQRSLHQY